MSETEPTLGEVYRLILQLREHELTDISDTLKEQNGRIAKTENRLTRLETITGLVGSALTAAMGWVGWAR